MGLPGPYGDKGGKFLLLPPGYKGDVPKDGYQVLRGTMNNYNIMVRGIVTSMEDASEAVQTVKKLQVYPWSERSNPKATTYSSFSGKKIDTLPPAGLEYWERLSAVINNNPVEERDRFIMAMLKPLGIEKGKPFNPDARQRAILEDAARIGDAMGRTMLFEGDQRIAGANAFGGTHWNWVVLNRFDQETEHYSQLDERLHYTYGAIYTSPNIGSKKPGPGSEYVQTFKDKDGNHLDGGQVVPAPRAPGRAGRVLLVTDALRHGDPFDGRQREPRRRPVVLRQAQGQCRWLDRPVLRPEGAGGSRRQLDRNGARQRLLPDVPLLRAQAGCVRRVMEAA